MRIVTVKVDPFRSINTPQTVHLDRNVTVLVGMNEAGKTVLLKALEKTRDALGLIIPNEERVNMELPLWLIFAELLFLISIGVTLINLVGQLPAKIEGKLESLELTLQDMNTAIRDIERDVSAIERVANLRSNI